MNPWWLLAVVLAFAAGGIAGERDGAHRADLRWTAKTEKARADGEADARVKTVANFRNMEVSYAANRLEIKKHQAAAFAADRAARGLRDDLAAIRRALPGNTSGAGLVAVDACHLVLGGCVDRYREVAQAADEHAADVRLCHDAWPH